MIRVGITTFVDQLNGRNHNMVGVDYARGILNAGAIPILIPLIEDQKSLDYYMGLIDALVLTGGDDLHPKYYNETNFGKSRQISELRDEQELYLIKKAVQAQMPILGICRGLQLLNVYFGGTLYQDIETQCHLAIDHETHVNQMDLIRHSVLISQDSMLHTIYKQVHIHVNSRHHQAIKDLGTGLWISGLSEDGIVEAVEAKQGNILGVQWHPENLMGIGGNGCLLFEYFVDIAT